MSQDPIRFRADPNAPLRLRDDLARVKTDAWVPYDVAKGLSRLSSVTGTGGPPSGSNTPGASDAPPSGPLSPGAGAGAGIGAPGIAAIVLGIAGAGALWFALNKGPASHESATAGAP